MRMQLGRKADYSIRAVLHLARHWATPGRRKGREIADDMGIPAKYLPQVMAALVRVGVVDSEPGPEGGYRLARPPADVNLLEMIESIEGPIESQECILRGGVCAWGDRCAIHETWAAAQDALRRRLGETTFADLAEVEARLAR
jgi:Rrf2 family protein